MPAIAPSQPKKERTQTERATRMRRPGELDMLRDPAQRPRERRWPREMGSTERRWLRERRSAERRWPGEWRSHRGRRELMEQRGPRVWRGPRVPGEQGAPRRAEGFEGAEVSNRAEVANREKQAHRDEGAEGAGWARRVPRRWPRERRLSRKQMQEEAAAEAAEFDQN